ncbi:sushi, von Willebrand factor type A, EGF and pentraxin domain-containing protein 1-like [Mya arenaria]|uniref:sushi, von Willebrand factor type A, EGF and pentraxin domain-containing protein 1-like n=1 Tax=Mya arenaria TaxID=6604 RepID=UPI0022E88D4F|nr:sushi, von Willebrand factor type A, EGF and pentraxin domain-containing protein 1-like [Mya arenaria]
MCLELESHQGHSSAVPLILGTLPKRTQQIVIVSVIGELSTFENNIQSSCNRNWDAQVVTVNLLQTAKFSATLKLTLLSSATTIEKKNCLDIIRNNSALFNFGNTYLQCGTFTAAISVATTSTGDIEVTCRQSYHFKVTSADLAVDFCVPCGPGLFYSSSSQSCEACPDDHYNGNIMQTTCLSCNSGSYPNAARTNCQYNCPAGYISTDGFYPCTPCAADSYSSNTTTCAKCPNGGSTVGVPAASSVSQCYNPCPKGEYSISGFRNTQCNPCPLHHFQPFNGMTYCDPCPSSAMTSQTGGVHDSFCVPIEDCNSTYCNARGTCETAFGRKNCQCDVGYYGDQCEKIIHICNGNPCTNGGTCVYGDGQLDYTCNCVTDYDRCVMETKAERMGGNKTGEIDYQQVQDKAACELLCLNNDDCIEATFFTSISGSFICRLFNTEAYLQSAFVAGTVHMAKRCTKGFTGNNCEVDNVDNCIDSKCHETSRCVDKINDYECICSSSKGFAGKYCATPKIPCDASPCQNGSCINVDNIRYECTCQDGYDGINCDNNIISDKAKSSSAIIIGASVSGGLTLLTVVAFFIYRHRKRGSRLHQEERSGRNDIAHPRKVFDITLDRETDISNTEDGYEAIPADFNCYINLKVDQSPAGPFEDTVQNVDSVSSERNVYNQLDVDRLKDRAKEYQQLNLKDHHDYLVPMRTEKISNINTSNL